MRIEMGKYTLCGDSYSMWIIETRMAKKPKKEDSGENEYLVAGYCSTFDELLEDFQERKLRGSDARAVEALLADVAKTNKDMVKVAKDIVKAAKVTRKELKNAGKMD